MQEGSITASLSGDSGNLLSSTSEPYWLRVWAQFRRHTASMLGLFILIVFALLALTVPLFATDPTKINLTDETRLKPPSSTHWFGTDHLGRDVLARSLHGARVSLLVGFMSSVIAILIGSTFGSLAGYFGGVYDNLLMRFIDLFLSIPLLFVLIILQSLLDEPSLLGIILVLGATSWMHTARVVRGEILKEREIDYVTAAHSLGATSGRIIFFHLLPNVIGAVIVISTLQVGRVIILEASLSYLGFGVQPPNASWGSMLAEARGYLNTGPWMAIFPGLLLSLTVLSFNFLGDGLASALNPFEKR